MSLASPDPRSRHANNANNEAATQHTHPQDFWPFSNPQSSFTSPLDVSKISSSFSLADTDPELQLKEHAFKDECCSMSTSTLSFWVSHLIRMCCSAIETRVVDLLLIRLALYLGNVGLDLVLMAVTSLEAYDRKLLLLVVNSSDFNRAWICGNPNILKLALSRPGNLAQKEYWANWVLETSGEESLFSFLQNQPILAKDVNKAVIPLLVRKMGNNLYVPKRWEPQLSILLSSLPPDPLIGSFFGSVLDSFKFVHPESESIATFVFFVQQHVAQGIEIRSPPPTQSRQKKAIVNSWFVTHLIDPILDRLDSNHVALLLLEQLVRRFPALIYPFYLPNRKSPFFPSNTLKPFFSHPNHRLLVPLLTRSWHHLSIPLDFLFKALEAHTGPEITSWSIQVLGTAMEPLKIDSFLDFGLNVRSMVEAIDLVFACAGMYPFDGFLARFSSEGKATVVEINGLYLNDGRRNEVREDITGRRIEKWVKILGKLLDNEEYGVRVCCSQQAEEMLEALARLWAKIHQAEIWTNGESLLDPVLHVLLQWMDLVLAQTDASKVRRMMQSLVSTNALGVLVDVLGAPTPPLQLLTILDLIIDHSPPHRDAVLKRLLGSATSFFDTYFDVPMDESFDFVFDHNPYGDFILHVLHKTTSPLLKAQVLAPKAIQALTSCKDMRFYLFLKLSADAGVSVSSDLALLQIPKTLRAANPKNPTPPKLPSKFLTTVRESQLSILLNHPAAPYTVFEAWIPDILDIFTHAVSMNESGLETKSKCLTLINIGLISSKNGDLQSRLVSCVTDLIRSSSNDVVKRELQGLIE